MNEMNGMASVLMGTPEKGYIWYCTEHHDFGYAGCHDCCIAMSESHYDRHIHPVAKEAVRVLHQAFYESESLEEALENARSAVEVIREWDFFSDTEDDLWFMEDSEESFSAMVYRLEVADCTIFMADIEQAVAYYPQYATEINAYALAHHMPMLIAAQVVGDNMTHPGGVGDEIASEIEHWLQNR